MFALSLIGPAWPECLEAGLPLVALRLFTVQGSITTLATLNTWPMNITRVIILTYIACGTTPQIGWIFRNAKHDRRCFARRHIFSNGHSVMLSVRLIQAISQTIEPCIFSERRASSECPVCRQLAMNNRSMKMQTPIRTAIEFSPKTSSYPAGKLWFSRVRLKSLSWNRPFGESGRGLLTGETAG